MKKLLALLLLLPLLSFATTYYVDTSGNDSNNGTSILTPWKTLAQVTTAWNSFVAAGDSILFKRGQTFIGSCNLSGGGSSGSPIIFSAYSTGAKPILTLRQSVTGWGTSGNWTNEGSNRWSMTVDFTSYQGRNYPQRIWLSGIEGAKAQTSIDVNSTTTWFYSSGVLWVYATSNPSSFYTNVEYPGKPVSNYSTTFTFNSAQYITLKNLDFRGGQDDCIYVGYSSYCIIEDCSIGRDAGFNGVTVGSSYDIIIRRDSLDSGDRIIDHWYQTSKGCNDAIQINGASSLVNIYNNYFNDWGHAGVYLINLSSTDALANNKVYSNYFTAPDVDYCRAFAADIAIGNYVSTGNEFYFNYAENMTAPIQLDCPYLSFHHNVINHITNANHGGPTGDGATGYGIGISAYGGTAAHDMKIYNNVIANTDEPGFYYNRNVSTDSAAFRNFVRNNIFYKCGLNSTVGSNKQGYAVVINNAQPLGSLIFQNNLLFGDSTNIINNGHYSSNVYSRLNDRTVAQYNSDNGLSGDTISGNLFGNPLFISYTNFALQQGSPAIRSGINLGDQFKNSLDVNSVWPLSVNTIAESDPWDMGAFNFIFQNPIIRGRKAVIKAL